MEIPFPAILLFFGLFLIFQHLRTKSESKIKEEKEEADRLKEENRRREILLQLSEYPELKKQFKKVLNIDLSQKDYKDWIIDQSGNPGESFIGYMIRKNRLEKLNVKIDQILEKTNRLSNEEVFSITPKGRGVNVEEMKKHYRKVYWEDRKKDMEYD